MFYKIPVFLLVGLSACIAREHEEEHHHLPAQYSFAYGVQDHKSADLKNHQEERNGDHTSGEYSLIEPDGTKRTVKYTVEGKSGFNAVVTREGKNVKETYYYGGKEGSSFEHKTNLVHEQGHSNGENNHGHAGTSSLSYNRADLKSGGAHSNAHDGSSYAHGSSQGQYGQHGGSLGGSGGGSFSHFTSKHSGYSSSHQSHPQGKLVVVHKTPVVALVGGIHHQQNHQIGGQLIHYAQPNHIVHHQLNPGHQQQIIHHGQQNNAVEHQMTSAVPHIQQIISHDGGNAYYNLNDHNSQKIQQGAAQLMLNENYHHPERHDYRGDFGHRGNNQAQYEQNTQHQYNSQKATAHPDAQQYFLHKQDEEQQRAQTVENNQHGYNPQIHLANQINSYNQQQMTKLYEVKPMMEDKLRSKGIVLYYGKENKFSNEHAQNMRHMSQYGAYVQFHNSHNQNQHTMNNYAQNNMHQYHQQMINSHQGQQNIHQGQQNIHQGNALYSNQHGGDGYATSYQNFALKGAKVFLSTKHIVPPKQHHSN